MCDPGDWSDENPPCPARRPGRARDTGSSKPRLRAACWPISPSIRASSPSMVRLNASREDGLPGLCVSDRDPFMVLLASMMPGGSCRPNAFEWSIFASVEALCVAARRRRWNHGWITSFQTQPFMKHGKQAVNHVLKNMKEPRSIKLRSCPAQAAYGSLVKGRVSSRRAGENAAPENFDVYAHVNYLYKPEQSDPVGTEVFGGR